MPMEGVPILAGPHLRMAAMKWKTGFLPGTTQFAGGPYTRVSDPSVAYDRAHHTWMISSLAEVGSGSTLATHTIIVNLSTDGGLTWSKPYKVIDGGSTYYDKDWITCDSSSISPYFGNCYIEWDNDDKGGLLLMSVSKDGGRTWSKPQTTADKALGLGRPAGGAARRHRDRSICRLRHHEPAFFHLSRWWPFLEQDHAHRQHQRQRAAIRANRRRGQGVPGMDRLPVREELQRHYRRRRCPDAVKRCARR